MPASERDKGTEHFDEFTCNYWHPVLLYFNLGKSRSGQLF